MARDIQARERALVQTRVGRKGKGCDRTDGIDGWASFGHTAYTASFLPNPLSPSVFPFLLVEMTRTLIHSFDRLRDSQVVVMASKVGPVPQFSKQKTSYLGL